MKKNLVVFYGGVSCEHDISIITALQVMNNADKEKYSVVPVYIGRDGVFRTSNQAFEIDAYMGENSAKTVWREVTLLPRDNGLYALRALKRLVRLFSIDAAIICCHGMNGEDGTLQGLLELCSVPYSSASVAGSAIGMDKIFMKRVFASLGFSALPFFAAKREQFKTDRENLLKSIEEKLSYPMIVKPSNLGSSIGINRCECRTDLCFALSVAFKFDSKALIERAVENLREVNISALCVDGKVEVSECEEPILWQSFLSFDDKYMADGDKSGGMANAVRKLPADITPQQKAKIEEYAVRLYTELECTGVVRVDYIIDSDDNEVYINEINTIPGSFAFYLWEKRYTLRELIDIVVANAEEKCKTKKSSTYAFESKVLEHYNNGSKTRK